MCINYGFRHEDQVRARDRFYHALLSDSNMAAVAGVDALIAPKPFKSKDKDPETLLIDFDLYIKSIKNFFIATGRDDANNKQKVALLQAVGGPDMVDMVEEVVNADTFEQAIE